MGVRYYQPDIGRWLTRDSYRGSQIEPLTQNKYTYVENNPINRTDPTGNWSAYEPKSSPLYKYTHFRMTFETADLVGFKYRLSVASGARDLDNVMYAAVFYPSLHFDYQEGSGLVNDSRYRFFRRQWSSAASLVRTRPSIAAYELGKGLHSLQDRFAHGYISKWEHMYGKYKHVDDQPLTFKGDPNYIPNPRIETKRGWPGYPDRIKATKKMTKHYLSKFKRIYGKYF